MSSQYQGYPPDEPPQQKPRGARRYVIEIMSSLVIGVIVTAIEYLIGFSRSPIWGLIGGLVFVGGLAIYAGTQLHKEPLRRFLFVFPVMVLTICAAVGLYYWAPLCEKNMIITFEATRQNARAEVLFGEDAKQLEVTPDESIMFRAYPVEMGESSDVTCTWHFVGDGFIEDQAGCIAFVRAGTDAVEDDLSVDIREVACPGKTTDGVFLLPGR